MTTITMTTRTQKIGTAAMLGRLTAAIALLAGLPPTQADELADRKANQPSSAGFFM
jgi:uncharacterized membrane protein